MFTRNRIKTDNAVKHHGSWIEIYALHKENPGETGKPLIHMTPLIVMANKYRINKTLISETETK